MPPSESDPLISCFITIFLLILLYLPHHLRILLFPVVILASFILLFLLRLGVAQRTQTQSNAECNEKKETSDHSPLRNNVEQLACSKEKERGFEQSFFEWDVGAPLEVIYEDQQEGQEEDHGLELNQIEGDGDDDDDDTDERPVERYYPVSLSLCFPESDSDSSSSSSDGDFAATGNWGSPERVCFRLDDQYDGDELIEIALDKRGLDLHGDELIEIDVSSASGFH